MATHSSILAWRIPWTEEPGGLQSMGRKESETTERLKPSCGRAFPNSPLPRIHLLEQSQEKYSHYRLEALH